MDEETGQRSWGRTPGGGEPPVHPLRGPCDDPPPRREQLPLPRRDGQSHLAPQLRTPGGAGGGTPFAPFVADTPVEKPGRHASDRVADFHAATRRNPKHRRSE